MKKALEIIDKLESDLLDFNIDINYFMNRKFGVDVSYKELESEFISVSKLLDDVHRMVSGNTYLYGLYTDLRKDYDLYASHFKTIKYYCEGER